MMKIDEKTDRSEELLQDHIIESLCGLSDGVDEVIYVLDPDNYEILFANKRTQELFGKRIIGKKCYKVFQKRDSTCPECSNKYIFGKNLGKTYTWDHQNQWSKRWYRGIYKAIKWPGGKYVKYGISIDITAQKRMEEKLRESELFFRSLVKNSHNGILILDDKFRIIYANDEIRRIGKRSKSSIIGHDFREFLDKSGKALAQEKYLRRQRGKKAPSRYEFKITTGKGEKRDVEVKSSVVSFGCGRKCTMAQLIDITEKKKMEEERKRLEDRLSALNMYGQRLNMARNMEEVYKQTLDAMEKTLGFEFGDIFIIEGKKLCLQAHRGHSKELSVKLPMDGNKGITVRVARTGRPVFLSDVQKEKAYVRGGEGIRSELAVPVRLRRKVLGVLNVESRRLSAFNKEDRKLLEILASHAAIAISNLRKQDQLRDILKKLEYLMKNTTEIMHVKKMNKRLAVIARAIQKFGWRRVVISLRNENLEGTDLVTAGLTEEEKKLLMKRKATGHVWKERLGQNFERFKIGEFYYLPWTNPWVREKVHGVPHGASLEKTITYAGVPSKLSVGEMVDWHPQDMLYAPLRTPERRVVGILSMDDPIDGRKPTQESLTPLELFLHQAAIIVENAQLIEDLKEARELLEQKVEERTRELNESQGQLLKAQRLAVIGELAGMVGHDLRNPLTSIAGIAYYVKKRLERKNRGKMKDMLELAERNIAYANKIISDLLDYSREIRLDLVECNPKSVVKEALSFIEIPKYILLRDLTSNEPKIRADLEKLTRAFVNIIKNATEAMAEGGTLTIRSAQHNGILEFTFSDTGLGMSKQILRRIWTPLFTTKAKGMGFGLPICKRVIEAHGGSISVKSVKGKGTTFTLTLPVEPQIEEEGGEKIWVKQPESSLLTMTKT